MCVFSCVQLFLIPWIIVHQAPMSMDFSRQEYWSGLPFSTPRDLPDPGVEPASLMSPALKGRFFTNEATWEAQLSKTWINYSFSLLYFQLLPSDDSSLSTYLNIRVSSTQNLLSSLHIRSQYLSLLFANIQNYVMEYD